MSDVEIAQLTPAAVPVGKNSSWSRIFVALAAAVSASSATTQCSECTGSCRTEEALTGETDVEGVSLALGYYDGETFVAA